MKTTQEQIEEIMETLLAHQPIIDVPYEKINDIAIALVKEGYGDVKQAQIEVLNKLKEIYGYYSCYSWENDVRSLNVIIDEFIKEVENDN